jgi:hypothetical protein
MMGSQIPDLCILRGNGNARKNQPIYPSPGGKGHLNRLGSIAYDREKSLDFLLFLFFFPLLLDWWIEDGAETIDSSTRKLAWRLSFRIMSGENSTAV